MVKHKLEDILETEIKEIETAMELLDIFIKYYDEIPGLKILRNRLYEYYQFGDNALKHPGIRAESNLNNAKKSIEQGKLLIKNDLENFLKQIYGNQQPKEIDITDLSTQIDSDKCLLGYLGYSETLLARANRELMKSHKENSIITQEIFYKMYNLYLSERANIIKNSIIKKTVLQLCDGSDEKDLRANEKKLKAEFNKANVSGDSIKDLIKLLDRDMAVYRLFENREHNKLKNLKNFLDGLSEYSKDDIVKTIFTTVFDLYKSQRKLMFELPKLKETDIIELRFYDQLLPILPHGMARDTIAIDYMIEKYNKTLKEEGPLNTFNNLTGIFKFIDNSIDRDPFPRDVLSDCMSLLDLTKYPEPIYLLAKYITYCNIYHQEVDRLPDDEENEQPMGSCSTKNNISLLELASCCVTDGYIKKIQGLPENPYMHKIPKEVNNIYYLTVADTILIELEKNKISANHNLILTLQYLLGRIEDPPLVSNILKSSNISKNDLIKRASKYIQK